MIRSAFAIGILVVWTPLAAQISEDYELLVGARYSSAVPLEGEVSWDLDGAKLSLESGEVSLAERTQAGFVTGLVFEGQGRLEIPVPDRYELRQLRRFAEDPSLEAVSQSFDRMFLRTSDPRLLPKLGELAQKAGGPLGENSLAKKHTREWLLFYGHDPDARVMAGLGTPGDRYVRLDVRSEDFGWLTLEFESLRAEELELLKFDEGRLFVESWLNLDRASERLPDGRAGSQEAAVVALEHFDSELDLTKVSHESPVGAGSVVPVDGRFKTRVRYRSMRPGLTALVLDLDSWARVDAVRTSDGRELGYVRKHFGPLSNVIHKRTYDSSLVVELPEPLAADQTIELDFEYEALLYNYGSLLMWYPTPRGMALEPHSSTITATYKRDYGFKATGTRISEDRVDGGIRSVWKTQVPINGAAFTLALKPHEKSYEFDGLPEIVLFGTQRGDLSSQKIEGFSADIINSINFFQNLFGTKVESTQLNATLIAAGHGQAARGLLHVSDAIGYSAGTGVREAFLAHEVAHEWWGHQVGWTSYRDQWLSEGFAEYSAMMFIAASLDGGERVFRDILRDYNEILTTKSRARERMGPIGHGVRAGTAEAPSAYVSMSYLKGAMVVHMLRRLLRAVTGKDEMFFTVLRDFVSTYKGRTASTEDFQAILSKHANTDWSWFFDQWVYGTHIPTFDYSYDVKQAGDGWELTLEVEMTEVPEGFRVAVPVQATFKGGRSGELLVMIDEPKKTIVRNLPDKPNKVVFNPDFAVVAKMK